MGKPTFDICNSKTRGAARVPARALCTERGRGEWSGMPGRFWTCRYQMKVFVPEYIGGFKQTRGTETSQYPEERTSTETPLVVASESGPGQ